MARKKAQPHWSEDFDLEAEITTLVERIEAATEFRLPDRKRDLVFAYAARKLQAEIESAAEKGPKPNSTSRNGFLEYMQDTIFMAIPQANVEKMPVTEYVLRDPKFYLAALERAASITEADLFDAISPIIEDMTISEARALVSQMWHAGFDDNARKYAEALKRSKKVDERSRPHG